MQYTPEQRLKIINSITVKGLVVNILLIIVKFLAGILGRSSAMIADAVHSISDVVTDVVVLASASVSAKPRDHDHQFGHGKIETLTTAFVGIMLFAAGVFILFSGVELLISFIKGSPIQKPELLAFYMAIVSVVLKEFLYRYTLKVGKKVNSTAVIANAWHHRSDAFSSIGTLIGIGGAVFLGDKWLFLDPLAAVIVSIFIFKLAVKLTYESLKELVETALPNKMQQEIIDITASVEGVIEPHNFKTRRIGNTIAIEMHIYVKDTLNIVEAHDITKLIEQKLKAHFGADIFISIHTEPYGCKKGMEDKGER